MNRILAVALALYTIGLRAQSLNSQATKVLWVGTSTIAGVPANDKKTLHLFSKDLSLKAKIKLLSSKIIGLHFSPEDRLVALAVEKSDKKMQTVIYDGLGGQPVFDVEFIPNLRSMFWIDSCQLAILSTIPKKNGLENKLEVFRVPDKVTADLKITCRVKDKSKSSLPEAFFASPAAYWGIFSDGSRQDFSWIGRGDFRALRPGKFPFFYFLSASGLIRARVDQKKIQPVFGNVKEYYPSKSDDTLLVLQDEGAVKLLVPKSPGSFNYAEKVLKASGVMELWSGANSDWYLTRDTKGKWESSSLAK